MIRKIFLIPLIAAAWCAPVAPAVSFTGDPLADFLSAPATPVPDNGAIVSQNFLPAPPAADHVALLFHKLAGGTPDFRRMLMDAGVFAEVGDEFERARMVGERAEELESQFVLTTTADKMALHLPVKLLSYSARNHGFAIEGMERNSYFPFAYLGQHYAIAVAGLENEQWISVPDDRMAMMIDQSATPDTRMVMAALTVEGVYADRRPVRLGGEEYYMISAVLRDFALYNIADGRLIWRKADHDATGDVLRRQELFELYR